MDEMNRLIELTEEALASVSGGVGVNTGSDSNAGVWKKFEDIGSRKASYSLPNGTDVEILGAAQYHSGKGRNYVKILFTHKGKTCKGWIAASIVGMGK